MKVRWKQQITKPCYKVVRLKELPMARVFKEDDVPDVAEYNEQIIGGKITVMDWRYGEFSLFETVKHWIYGVSLEEAIRQKYSCHYAHIENVQSV